MRKDKNTEALDLATEILKNIELNETPLSRVVGKSLRLARLRGDKEALRWLQLEMSGYTSSAAGVPPDEWSIGIKSKRHFHQKDKYGTLKTLMRLESVGRIEAEIETAREQLKVSSDPDVSVSSSNPSQTVFSPWGNKYERSNLRTSITKWTSVLERISFAVYDYVLGVYHELKFGSITESIFDKARNRVDNLLSTLCPGGLEELVSAYENLSSSNSKDWSNAATSCRRMLKELADVLYPPTKKSKSKRKLTEDAYINRLMAYVEKHSKSNKFKAIVGSQLTYLADRLDAIYDSASKGVHGTITKDEAERIVIYTYLIAGDILTLVDKENLKIKVSDKISVTDEVSLEKQKEK